MSNASCLIDRVGSRVLRGLFYFPHFVVGPCSRASAPLRVLIYSQHQGRPHLKKLLEELGFAAETERSPRGVLEFCKQNHEGVLLAEVRRGENAFLEEVFSVLGKEASRVMVVLVVDDHSPRSSLPGTSSNFLIVVRPISDRKLALSVAAGHLRQYLQRVDQRAGMRLADEGWEDILGRMVDPS